MLAPMMRLAVAGKGGVGKSVVSATLARLLARRGHKVLVLDSDTLPGLTISLGVDPPEQPPLLDAVEKNDKGRWRLRKGIGPVRAIQRYSTPAPDGVRLLQLGKLSREGSAPLFAATNAYYQIVHRISHDERTGRASSLQDWVLLGDLPAGARQIAYDWAPYAERFLLVVEPTSQSMMTARRIARLVTGMRADADIALVVNKARSAAEAEKVATFLEREPLAVVPFDHAVRLAEREGAALIDHAPACEAVAAIGRLADRLEADSLVT